MADREAGTIKQTARLLQIKTPLGADDLLVRSLTGREALSELFELNVDLASPSFHIQANSLIAQRVTVKIRVNDSNDRYVDGFVNRFSLAPTFEDKLAHYRLRIVPAVWFLTRTTNCSIFQEKTTPQIIEQIFRRYGIVHFRMDLRRNYMTRTYCVQYRESAFNFISRLMEEEGICYFFEHSENFHTMVLADSPSAHSPSLLDNNVSWAPASGAGFAAEENYISQWSRSTEVRPRKWTQADFQFEKPMSHLFASEPTLSTVPGPELELYDYPGRFENQNDGRDLTRVRIEEQEAAIDVVCGEGNCSGFVPGFSFTLKQIYESDQSGSFLITGIDYQAEQGSLYHGDRSTGGSYENRFTAIPAQTQFRPPRLTARPIVHGPQTAFVTGPSGEEIYVDQYGRVKVQFHWDREGQYNEATSCWIRVSQTMAGKSWGAVQLPRVGHEVVVEFLEGDPDRPLITGELYNADHTVPYKLPDEKSKLTLKSLSYPGGNGFNEIRMEDKKNSEQVFIHAEKDFDLRVKNDRREWIGQDRHLVVQRDKLEQIGRDRHEAIEGKSATKIIGDRHVAVMGSEALSVGGSHSFAVTGNVSEQFNGNQSTQVTGSCYIKGMQVVMEATTGLTINVGSNFITINEAGIQMYGEMVVINGIGVALPGMPGNVTNPLSPTAPATADDAQSGQSGSGPDAASSAFSNLDLDR